MNLSPFGMKSLLHHILSGKEFGVERSSKYTLGSPLRGGGGRRGPDRRAQGLLKLQLWTESTRVAFLL